MRARGARRDWGRESDQGKGGAIGGGRGATGIGRRSR